MARSSQSYRGRSQGPSPILKGLVILLAVLLALALGLTVYLGRYVQYTDEGPKLRLPWGGEPAGPSAPPRVSDLVIEGTARPTAGVQDPEPSPPEEDPAPAFETLLALEIDAAEVTAGRAADLCAAAGANTLVVRVKDENGVLAWRTDQTLARGSELELNGDPAFNTAVSVLKWSEDVYMVARVTGFQDLWTSVYIRETAVASKTDKLWYDAKGYSWMGLSSERARSYLTGLCLELAEMGFDEVLLEHAAWPDNGKVSNIAEGSNYPAEGREELAAAWLRELSDTLAEVGVRLSVQPSESKPDDGGVSGLTPAALCGLSGRVWLSPKADPAVWLAALEGAGMEDAALRLVLPEGTASAQDWTGSRVLPD